LESDLINSIIFIVAKDISDKSVRVSTWISLSCVLFVIEELGVAVAARA